MVSSHSSRLTVPFFKLRPKRGVSSLDTIGKDEREKGLCRSKHGQKTRKMEKDPDLFCRSVLRERRRGSRRECLIYFSQVFLSILEENPIFQRNFFTFYISLLFTFYFTRQTNRKLILALLFSILHHAFYEPLSTRNLGILLNATSFVEAPFV